MRSSPAFTGVSSLSPVIFTQPLVALTVCTTTTFLKFAVLNVVVKGPGSVITTSNCFTSTAVFAGFAPPSSAGDAVISHFPALTAVITPFSSTVATASSEEVQISAGSVGFSGVSAALTSAV